MMVLAKKIKLRPFRFKDGQAIVDLFNAHSQYLFGWDETDLAECMNDWTSPGFDAEQMIRVLENDQGKLIGYIDVWDTTQPHVIKYIWGVLHPDDWDPTLYRELLTWAEEISRERIELAPEGARVVMSQGIPHKDHLYKTALEEYGFRLVRYFYRMQIELEQAPAKPSIPDGLVIKPIDMECELEEAILAMEEAFQDHWGHVNRPADEVLEQWNHWLENNKDFDPTLWFLAKDGDQIAGVCRCAGKMVEDPEMGWVNQLCVRKPWRRQGLGMALLLTAFQEYYRRGKQRVGLAVDADSLTNATRLYEKAGMHVHLQYDSYELELRPGEDLMKKQP